MSLFINKQPVRELRYVRFTPAVFTYTDMGSDTTTLRLNETRKRRLDKVEDQVDKNSRAGAIDEATKHYLRAREDLEELAEELEDEFQERADQHALGTWELNVTVEIEE